MVSRALAPLLVLFLFAFAGRVEAEEPAAGDAQDAAAKLAFEHGLELLRAQRWTDAEAEFRSSLAAVPRASARYNLAFVLFKQGRLRESVQALEQLLNDGASEASDPRYRDAAKALLSQALTHLSILRLTLEPESSALRIDGEPIALSGRVRSVPLDPGAHHLELTAPGFAARQVELSTAARVETQLEIRLHPAPRRAPADDPPDASPKPPRTSTGRIERSSSWGASNGPWLAMGTGAALLAAGIVVGLVTSDADDTFSRKCPTHINCDQSLAGESRRIGRLAATTNVLLASGVVVAVAGVAWKLVVASSEARDDRRASVAIVATGHY